MTALARILQGCTVTALLALAAQSAAANAHPSLSLGRSVALTTVAQAQLTPDAPASPLQLPDLLPAAESRRTVSGLIQLVLIITVLSLAPAIIVMVTCFTRIIVVLALTRQALGTSQLPPMQILVGLALLLTVLIMAPTWSQLNTQALQPYLSGKIAATQAIDLGQVPLRGFMIRQIEACNNQDDVWIFLQHTGLRGQDVPLEALPAEPAQTTWADVPTRALLPAFVISELKTAFLMGFKIYLPFLVIDMVVASILISMGMLMLPPVLVSLPFKILLFVLVNGWHLLAGSLLNSFD